MKKIFMAVIALMMTISTSAQFYIYCQNGSVIVVDSISMLAPAAVEGVFSVSETKQVNFSKGNLQYDPANDEWRFAESQLDYLGYSQTSSTYNGWLDKFYWSTGANNFGANTSYNDVNCSGSFIDWGTNKIGSDAPNTWRTLTNDEWNYLLNNRNNASSLYGVASVNGVNGLIFLPDNWVCTFGVNFKSGVHSKDGEDYYAAYQSFTADQWSKLEESGAIFLPAVAYWSATSSGSYAYYIVIDSDEVRITSDTRYRSQSVRLVKDVE